MWHLTQICRPLSLGSPIRTMRQALAFNESDTDDNGDNGDGFDWTVIVVICGSLGTMAVLMMAILVGKRRSSAHCT